MHGDRRSATVDHESAGIARGELELDRVLRHDHAIRLVCWNSCRVKIDRVRHRRVVDDCHADQITDADVNDGARDGATKGPTLIRNAFRDLERRVLDWNPELLDSGVFD